jgi:hypothetical protein
MPLTSKDVGSKKDRFIARLTVFPILKVARFQFCRGLLCMKNCFLTVPKKKRALPNIFGSVAGITRYDG